MLSVMLCFTVGGLETTEIRNLVSRYSTETDQTMLCVVTSFSLRVTTTAFSFYMILHILS